MNAPLPNPILRLPQATLHAFFIAGGIDSPSGDGFLTIRNDEIDW